MTAVARIKAFLEDWPGAEFGPAHIVLSDYNLDDMWIDNCLEHIDARGEFCRDVPDDELDATRAFLLELKTIPEDDRFQGLENDDDF